jgi:hypothetical protein
MADPTASRNRFHLTYVSKEFENGLRLLSCTGLNGNSYGYDFCSSRCATRSNSMKRAHLAILIIVVYGLTFGTFWATSVKTLTILSMKDSYSWQSVPDANNGGSDNFEITSSLKNPRNMRGWVQFDIQKIPSDAWVLSATLRLRLWQKTTNDPSQGIGDSTGRIYGVYQITQPWEEMNITWTNQPSYTENHHATAAVPQEQGGWNGPLVWMDWDLKDMVKAWRSGTPNYGVVVRDTQENSPILYSTQFFSHNKVPSPDYFPRLLVTYVTPSSVAVLVTIMGLEGVLIIFMWHKRNRL